MEQNGPLPKDGTKWSPAKRWNKTVPCQKMEQNGPLPKDGTKWSPAKRWNKMVSCQKSETVSCQIGTRSPARSIHGLLPKVGNGLLPDRYKTVSCQKLETVSCQIGTKRSPAKSWNKNGLLPKVGTKRSPAKSRNKMVSCQKLEQNGLLPDRNKRSPAKSRNKTVSCQKSEQNGLLPKVGTKRSPARSEQTVSCQKSEQKWSPAKSRNKMVSCQKSEKRSPARIFGQTVLPTDSFPCHPTQRDLFLQRSAHTWLVTCGWLLLHFLLNLVLWVLRPQPTTKGAANSLRNLIIWVGALAHEGAHSGRRNFKPKIPSESKDNYLRAFSGNSSARTGQATGEKRCCPLKWTFCFLHSQSGLSTRTGTYNTFHTTRRC